MVPQRIHDFITQHAARPICNACIGEGLGLPYGASHPAQITAALATTSEFIHEMGICSICSKERKVIRRLMRGSAGNGLARRWDPGACAMIDPEVLRNANEGDVEAALAGSYVMDICGHIEPAALLEFWNRMLDRFIGESDN